jgi:hypothetical protein
VIGVDGTLRSEEFKYKSLSFAQTCTVLSCLSCATPLVGFPDDVSGPKADRFCPYTAGGMKPQKHDERVARGLPFCPGGGHFISFDLRDHIGKCVFIC